MTPKANLDVTAISDIIQSVPVGIVAIRSTGQIEIWNAAAEGILGWKFEEVAGGPSPIELPRTAGEETEIRRTRKDASLVELHVRTIPWQDPAEMNPGLLVFLTDVTARHAAEHTVRELTAEGQEARSREREYMRFRELLEAAPDAIIEIEREGRIVLLNKATEQLFGYTREE